MSVLKSNRSQSPTEFEKNAEDLRSQIVDWMMRDFGTRKNIKHIQASVKGMSDEDIETVNGILAKYDRSPKQLQSVYPEWFIEDEIKFINATLHRLSSNIEHANKIYIYFKQDKKQRRAYQSAAIGDCGDLKKEIQFLVKKIGTDLNQIGDIICKIDREIDLLRGWKKSDSKRKVFKKKKEDKG